MKIKIFSKQNCAKCQTTKNKIAFFLKKWNLDQTIRTEFYDMDTVDGAAEGAYYDIWEIPGVIIENEDTGQIIKKWMGTVVPSEDLKKYLTN